MNQSDPRYDWMRQYAEGTASAETTAQLERALQEDAAFRKLFLEYLNVDFALSIGAADSELEPVAGIGRLPWVIWRAFVTGTTAAAALVLLTAFVAIWWGRDRLGNRAGPVTEVIDPATRVIDPYLAIIVDEAPDGRVISRSTSTPSTEC